MQTAEQTREIAANTLDALHQQGQKLEVVERDLYEVCSFGLIHRSCMDYAYATVLLSHRFGVMFTCHTCIALIQMCNFNHAGEDIHAVTNIFWHDDFCSCSVFAD